MRYRNTPIVRDCQAFRFQTPEQGEEIKAVGGVDASLHDACFKTLNFSPQWEGEKIIEHPPKERNLSPKRDGTAEAL